MSIKIGSYSFEGPFGDTGGLENRSGIYAILAQNGSQYTVIDIGESADVRDRVENHDRKDCWSRNGNGSLSVAAHYTPHTQQAGRRKIEQDLRGQYNPGCGVR